MEKCKAGGAAAHLHLRARKFRTPRRCFARRRGGLRLPGASGAQTAIRPQMKPQIRASPCGFRSPCAAFGSLVLPFFTPPPPQTQPKKQNEAQMLKSAPGQSWFLLGEGNLFALVLPIPVSANAEGGSYERFAFMSRAGTSG